MKCSSILSVYSEIGRLKAILLHRPTCELANLTPSNMKRLLFDDIPDPYEAEKEYELYVQTLQKAGVQTIFIEDLLTETLQDKSTREAFVQSFIQMSLTDENSRPGDSRARYQEALCRTFLDWEPEELAQRVICGLRKTNAPADLLPAIEKYQPTPDPLVLDPLPNLYFTRDPGYVIGNSVSISHMSFPARRRESFIEETILRHHPRYGGQIPVHYLSQEEQLLEGGDILVLSPEVLAIGVSQRTNQAGVLELAQNLFNQEPKQPFQHVLAFQIPATRAYMHLDTVFTMLDRNVFAVHSKIENTLTVLDITPGEKQLNIKEVQGSLSDILKAYLHLDQVHLISCGGGDPIDSEREQWNDGSNTLAIAPGEIIVYDRNRVTNHLFEEAGLKLYPIESSEISRGRGGPHCMSMPLVREAL